MLYKLKKPEIGHTESFHLAPISQKPHAQAWTSQMIALLVEMNVTSEVIARVLGMPIATIEELRYDPRSIGD